MPRNLSGSLALSKIKHVAMTCKGKNGDVRGIFVPFEANKLVVIDKKNDKGEITETQVYMPVNVHVKEEADQYGQHGFVSKTLDSKDYKALGTGDAAKAAAKEFTPILGSIKEFNGQGGSENDAVGNEESGRTFDPSDAVPF